MARSIWSGAISFGLVNVPVKLYSAVRDHSIHFHMLGPDGKCRLRRKLVCPETGKEVEWNDTKRGFEIAPEQYVIIENEELDALRPKATRTIEIRDFVDLAQIDPIYYNSPYYLAPDARAGKAFTLLREAMVKSGKVGIATFVMRQKEYLAAIRPYQQIMMLETMNYADEIADASDITEEAAPAKLDKRELDMAEKLIESLSDEFDPKKYKDEYRLEVQKLIERKSDGEEVHIAPPEKEPRRVHDLVKALEASLAEAKGRHAQQTERSSAARPPHRRTVRSSAGAGRRPGKRPE